MRKKKKSATPKQFEIIVSCLKHHGHLFAGSNNRHNKAKRREIWLQLTDVLNQNGPPVRKCKEWKITWSDYKYNLKRKLATDIKLRHKNYKKSLEKRLPFNKTERTVLAMLGLKDDETNQHEESLTESVPQSLAHIWHANDAAGSDVEIVEDTIDNKESILLCDDGILIEEPITQSVEPLFIDEELIEAPKTNANVATSLRSVLMAMDKTQQAILKELKESNRRKDQELSIKERLLTLEQEKFEETKVQNYEENKRAYTMIELRRKELELYELKLQGLYKQCHK